MTTAEWVFLTTAALAGATVGSFLNVVIFRGAALWGLLEEAPPDRGTFVTPRSYCPQCRTTLAWRDLVPIVSFVALGGKCRACHAPIPASYLLVECAGASAAIASVAAFGASVAAGLVAVALFLLIAIAEIDRRTGFIPDALSMSFLWLGLLANLDGRFAPLDHAVVGAVAGYGAFAVIGQLYRRLRGRDGLGDGDAVLLAGVGAWCGWAVLPLVVLIGAAATLVWVALRRLAGRKLALEDAIAFGPGLCFSGGIVLLAARAPWNPFAG